MSDKFDKDRDWVIGFSEVKEVTQTLPQTTMFGGPIDDIRDAFKRISQLDEQLRGLRDGVGGDLSNFRKSIDGELKLVGGRYTSLAIDLLKLGEELKDLRNKLASLKMPDRMPDVKVPASWPAWSALVLNAATLAAYFVFQLAVK